MKKIIKILITFFSFFIKTFFNQILNQYCTALVNISLILLEITKGVEKGGVQLKAQTKRKIASEWYSVPLRHCFLDGPHTLPLQNARAISLSYSTHALAEMGQCLVLSKISNGLSQYSFDRPWTFRAPFQIVIYTNIKPSVRIQGSFEIDETLTRPLVAPCSFLLCPLVFYNCRNSWFFCYQQKNQQGFIKLNICLSIKICWCNLLLGSTNTDISMCTK